MEQSVTVLAHAKVNLTLAVTGRRADGYHLLDTVMQSAALSDQLTVARRSAGVSLRCGDPRVPTDERNTAVRAAKLFFAASNIDGGAEIMLEKRIPYEAGLGSASADAAGVLAALNALCGEPLGRETLLSLALSVGADVPFCLLGGTKRAQGIGELLSDAPPMKTGAFVLAKPAGGVSTGEAYRALDLLENPPAPDSEALLRALAAGDLAEAGRCCGNVFLACCPLPACARLIATLKSLGACGASLSGSGSAVFGVFPDMAAAGRAAAAIAQTGVFAVAAPPISEGITILRE